MNLQINNTNFNGKREVLYNLTQAAKNAKEAEIAKTYFAGPHPIDMTHTINKHEAKMSAYIDSAVFDNEFLTTIKTLNTSSSELKNIQTILRKNRTNITINPIQLFKDELIKTANSYKKMGAEIIEFFKNI